MNKLKNNLNFSIFKRLYHHGIQSFAQPHIQEYPQKIAIHDNLGQHTYGDINNRSDKVGMAISRITKSRYKKYFRVILDLLCIQYYIQSIFSHVNKNMLFYSICN